MPPAPAGYSIRPPCREDLPAIRDLQVAADRVDGTERADSLARLEELFEDPWSNPETDAFVARDASGAVAAWGRTFLNPAPVLEARLHLTLDTHPDHRSDRFSTAFFERVEARARERLAAVPAGIPRLIVIPLDVRDETRRASLGGRGYQLERVFLRMRRDLREPIAEPAALPTPSAHLAAPPTRPVDLVAPPTRPAHPAAPLPLPAGLSMVPWRPELDFAFHEAFNETFSDHWSFEPVSADEWRQFFSRSSAFRADLTRGLLHGDELVGFSMSFVDPEENERTGRRQAWIGQIGVRRAWRKRGLATALLCESMRAFRAAGLAWAVLGVDAKSLTGAVGVYERVGFRTVQQTVLYTLAL
jgi:ribosomal protein S18 acetylase RimI-like enzyme